MKKDQIGLLLNSYRLISNHIGSKSVIVQVVFTMLSASTHVLKRVGLLLKLRRNIRSLLCVEQALSQFTFVYSQREFYRQSQAILAVGSASQLTLIYHPAIVNQAPVNFRSLQQSAKKHGWILKADSRLSPQPFLGCDRRKRNVFACGILSVSSLMSLNLSAEELTQPFWYKASNANNDATVVQALNLFLPASDFFERHDTVEKTSHSAFVSESVDFNDKSHYLSDNILNTSYATKKYLQALNILNKKWVKKTSDPLSFADDIDQLAQYIASQPKAYELLLKLSKQPLYLHYKAGEFYSVVKGSQFAVRSVRLYFDPRSAAQLKVHQECATTPAHCVASPADAFLHEMLHAKIALLDTAQFISSGAMRSVLYPRAHEREVINLERKMYLSMSNHDGIPRPMRNSHQATLLTANCVTCLGS